MSSSPGLPPQQATTTNLRSTLPPTSQQHQQHQHHLHHHHNHQQHTQTSLPTVSSTKQPPPPRKIPVVDDESESETVVLAEVVPVPRKIVGDPSCEYERGRRRRASEVRTPADQDRPHRTRLLRQGPAKRRLKDADHDDEEYSSDLSSAPSRSSRPESPSHPHPMRRRVKRDAGFTKRKTNGASTASDGDNSDDGNQNNNTSRPRLRKRRRSVIDSSPPRRRIKSSPPVSPQPLRSPSKNRTRDKIHVGRVPKHRKIPPPIATHDDQSSCSSRGGSPSAIPRARRPQSLRTPGSPMSTSHKPKRDTAGRTHLHRACQRGAVAEVRAILEAGKEFLNAEDNAGYLPLHEACLWGHLEVVKILINNGAWLDVPSRMEQDTPLLDAVDNGHADVVRYLLELGADPRKRNKQGQTALDANDSNRDTPEVFGEIEGLLKVAINKLRSKRSSDDEARASAAADSHSSSRDASVASPVHQSPPALSAPTGTRRRNARTEQSRKDLLWLDAGKNGLQKLREKAREGDQQMVHALLERGTKPDTESLIGAIKGGHADTVSLLLAYGDTIVDPEPGLRDGHRKMRDSSMPVGEETPMLAAIGRGNLIVLGYLLENGVNPRRLDSKGKSYMEIARDREGERWQEEVEMLKKAWEKAGRTSGGTTRRHSPVAHRNTSPKPKKVNDAKVSSRPRTNSSLSSATTARRSASANPSRYEDALAASDQEITAEPLGPPKNRKGKRNESDNLAPIAKKKRRLVSGRDLANEESLARSSQEPSRSVPPETDIDSSEKKLVARKTRTNPEELRSEPKQSGRKLRMGSEDPKISDLPTPTPVPERNTLKSRTDHDSNLLRPDNIPLKDRKLPTLGGKRDRTRSPTSHSDSGRRPDLDDPKRQRKMAEHKPEKYDSDSTVKRVPIKEEVPSKRKLHPGETAVRRDSPHARRPSLSADTLEREEERRRREKEELERQERRDRERRDRVREEDNKRRAQLEAEVKERKRQNHLRAEMESIISKAKEDSEKAQFNEVINREIFFRKEREEQERIEREIREREEREQEEREERERARVEREVREREERERGRVEREIREREVREREEEAANRRIERQAVEARERETREREAREREAREAREREMREREAREKEASEREAEQKRLELKHREEEERRHEEERRAEETRRRLEEEELQKRLAEEQRRKEEEAEAEKARHEVLENQRRAAEAERKRKAVEEERKRQEFERAQREKETRDRRVAEQLQQQLAAERKRVEEELAEKRRSEEEEERRRDLARREALPFALRQAEENHANRIVLDERERERFLPLYSATFSGHSPLGNATPTKAVNGFGAKPQLWILNVQAALVLGIMDLEFSNYSDVRHRRVTDQERLRMWSVLSVMLCESVYSSQRSIKELEKLRREERKKFLEMSPVFWMRVEDFRNIINTDSKYAGLANLSIRTIDVDLSFSNYSTPIKLNNGNVNRNGPMTPMSASVTKEEMALRLEVLFNTPPPRPPLHQLPQVQVQTSANQTLLPSLLAPPNNNSASMPPPTPINATNAPSASASFELK